MLKVENAVAFQLCPNKFSHCKHSDTHTLAPIVECRKVSHFSLNRNFNRKVNLKFYELKSGNEGKGKPNGMNLFSSVLLKNIWAIKLNLLPRFHFERFNLVLTKNLVEFQLRTYHNIDRNACSAFQCNISHYYRTHVCICFTVKLQKVLIYHN